MKTEETKKEAKTVAFSIKMKPDDKAELEAHLKHIAALKSISMGEAMKFAFDTLKTYGELPGIISEGFRDFNLQTSRKLNDIHRVMMMVGGDELHSEAAPNAVSKPAPTADMIDDGYNGYLVFEEIPVDPEDADREPMITRIGSRHYKAANGKRGA